MLNNRNAAVIRSFAPRIYRPALGRWLGLHLLLLGLAFAPVLYAVEAPVKPATPLVANKAVQDAFVSEVGRLPTVDAQFKRVIAKLKELNPGLRDTILKPFTDQPKTHIVSFNLNAQPVTEIWPVRAFTKLNSLSLVKTQVTDLRQIQGMPITVLVVDLSPVRDLKPLVGMKLTLFKCADTDVTDLSPLKGMPLTWLTLDNTGVSDLSPLKGMPLTRLFCTNTKVTDLTPIKGSPLTEIRCDRQSAMIDSLSGIPSLQTINGQPAVNVLNPGKVALLDAFEKDAFIKEVSALAPAVQVSRVKDRLQQLNPHFGAGDLVVTYDENKQYIAGVDFTGKFYTELWPIRAFPKLEKLNLSGSTFQNLAQLNGLPLKSLNISQTMIRDLTPLEGMPLTELNLEFTQVSEIAALKKMPLAVLRCDYTPEFKATLQDIPTLKTINGAAAADLLNAPDDVSVTLGDSPGAFTQEVARLAPEEQLQRIFAKLKELNPEFDEKFARVELDEKRVDVVGLSLGGMRVHTLWPIRAMVKMERLDLTNSSLRDLNQIKGMRLKKLTLSGCQAFDLSPLRGMPLTELACQDTHVADLSPLKGMVLTRLNCMQTKIADITPLQGMPLSHLELHGTAVADLSPLQGMPLTHLVCSATQITDLTPLAGMKLTYLAFKWTKVSDLTPLKGMPLTSLDLTDTRVVDLTQLQTLKIRMLRCDPKLENAEVLKTHPTLQWVNDNELKPKPKPKNAPPTPKPEPVDPDQF